MTKHARKTPPHVARTQLRDAGSDLVNYQNAARRNPRDPWVLNKLGNVLASHGRHEEAVVRYRQAIAFAPDSASIHHNLATALEALDHTHDALRHYQRAVALDPTLADAHLGFATVLRQLGHLEAANRGFETVIAMAPRNIAAYHGMSASKRFTAGDPYLLALENLDPSVLSEADRIFLHFTLGKAYDDLGQHERSFMHLVAGNRMKRRQFGDEEPRVLGAMDRWRELITSRFLHDMAGHGNPSRVPVFIVGMPRTGSTLVEQILASHPDVFGGGERPYFEQSLMAARAADPNGSSGGALFRALGERYLRVLSAAAPAASRITDKLLGNFNYLGLIALALPNAKIVHVRRDPLDTCLSCFSKLFSAPVYFSYDLAELGRYYRHYEQLMAHWRAVLPDGMMIEVRYEDLVDDIEGQARAIVAHCGLDWDDACLDFHRSKRAVRTASVAQVRQPLYTGSIGRARPLAPLLRPLIEALAGESATELAAAG